MKPTSEQLEKLWKLARFAAAVSADTCSKIPMSCGNADSFQAWVFKKHSIYRAHPECDIADALKLFWLPRLEDEDGEWQWRQACAWAELEAQKIVPNLTTEQVAELVILAVETWEVEGTDHLYLAWYGTERGLTELVVEKLGLDEIDPDGLRYRSVLEKAVDHDIPSAAVTRIAKNIWQEDALKTIEGPR